MPSADAVYARIGKLVFDKALAALAELEKNNRRPKKIQVWVQVEADPDYLGQLFGVDTFVNGEKVEVSE